MPELFGEKLRYVRQTQGLTQGELAEMVGLSAIYIHRLEVRRRAPSLGIVLRLALLLNLSTDYFLRDTIEVDALAEPLSLVDTTEAEMPQSFGAKLRALRLECQWGQTDLARKLNLKRRGYISNLEAGRKAPSLELIVQIADLFGVSIDYLLSNPNIGSVEKDRDG